MITQTVELDQFISRAQQIKTQAPAILSQWGLLPKFKRWRLAQDPGTGMVVLFGVLNNKYIATHATTPFSDYFDPRLLHDLARELHVQVISSANDGLRYAFILERGQLGIPTTPVVEVLEHYPIAQAPIQSNSSILVDEQAMLRQRLASFLKISEALDDLSNAPTQPVPDILFMNQAKFEQKMAEYETDSIITISKSHRSTD